MKNKLIFKGDEVWGIEVAGVKIGCKDYFQDWKGAKKSALARGERLLTKDELEVVRKHREEINHAFATLRETGRYADGLRATEHWAEEEFSPSHGCVVNLDTVNGNGGYRKENFAFYRVTLQ